LPDDATLRLTGVAAAETDYNPLVGQVMYQASATAGALWSRRRLSVDAQTTASTTLPGDSSPTVRGISGSLVGTYSLTRAVAVQAGARASSQLLPDSTAAPSDPLWVAFVALDVGAPVLQF
jgi:hypothetical protein